MCPGGAGREEDEIPRLELLLAAGMPKGRRARDDQEPLLVGIFVVVRADRLSGRQLVDAEPGASRAERSPDAGAVSPEAVGQLRTRLAANGGEVGSPNRLGAHRCSFPRSTRLKLRLDAVVLVALPRGEGDRSGRLSRLAPADQPAE